MGAIGGAVASFGIGVFDDLHFFSFSGFSSF